MLACPGLGIRNVRVGLYLRMRRDESDTVKGWHPLLQPVLVSHTAATPDAESLRDFGQFDAMPAKGDGQILVFVQLNAFPSAVKTFQPKFPCRHTGAQGRKSCHTPFKTLFSWFSGSVFFP